MGLKLLYAGFEACFGHSTERCWDPISKHISIHTLKAVTYHEQSHYCAAKLPYINGMWKETRNTGGQCVCATGPTRERLRRAAGLVDNDVAPDNGADALQRDVPLTVVLEIPPRGDVQQLVPPGQGADDLGES